MQDANRRALITGIGLLSPVAKSPEELVGAILEARSGLQPLEAFDASPFRTPYFGEVRDFIPGEHISSAECRLYPDRNIQMALAAARQALRDANLEWTRDNPQDHRTAIVVGTCNGGLQTAEEQYEILLGMRPGRFDRHMNLLIRYHSMGKALSYSLGVQGPTWIVTTACSSSTAALGLALDLIQHDDVDRVLVGGSDTICVSPTAGFDAVKATSNDRIAPFSQPVGLNLGEGAGFWVVEESRIAEARGANVLGEILGYALTSDAHHPTAPDPRGDGAYRTMVEALHHAGLSVEELGCINAHGTGTDVNDRTESKAVARLVGERPVPVYSFKSQVGHCLGAAGILEASAGLLAMRSGIVPATINFSEPRPGCSLDYVPNVPRKVKYKSFVSCNYAFGGNNAGAVIGLYEPGRSSKSRLCEKPRTVITGCGAVSSLGLGIAAHLEALISGKRGLRSIGERVGEETKAKLAGCVPPYSNRDVDRRLDFRSMKPISRFATAAARFALEAGGIRLGPREGKQTGIINGVYVGPSEESHLLHSIPSRGARADISSFTQVVANATAGWVSNALMLKGYTTTISQGADAGLFALLIAHYAVSHGSTPRLLAGAADELYTQYFKNYDSLDLLHTGEHEQNYKIALELDDRRVLGEGAAFVLAEEREHALKRKAKILAELVGYASTTSVESFKDNNHNSTMLSKTVGQALQMAGWQPGDVGLVLWTPKGNSADMGTLEGLRLALGPAADRVPLVTSVFHTGLCEATSGTITLAAVLAAWSEGTPLWKQITGVREIDERRLPAMPVRTLTVTASDLGFNLVLALEPGERLG